MTGRWRPACLGISATCTWIPATTGARSRSASSLSGSATPLGALAVAVVHLDSGTSPARRALQLGDLLGKLRQRGHGECAVVGGDFNTTTYDLQTVPRLPWNLVRKLVRGGFAHAIHHYLELYLLYEKPIFDQLERFGFDHQPFNAPGVGTTRY